MKKTTQVILWMLIATIISCTYTGEDNKQEDAKKHLLEKAYFLIGKWQNNSTTEKVTEIWEKESDSVLLGKSYVLKNGDTASSERIRLEAHGEQVFYIPVVKNQNEAQPVKFTMRDGGKTGVLIFENPEHDFPQQISYALITGDSLFAEISGQYKDQQQSEKFPMRRVN